MAQPLKKINLLGRPKTYTPEYLQRLAREMIEWFSLPDNIWLKDFAIERGIWWQRFVEFADECEEFAVALKIGKDMQESKLFKLGITKGQNPAMAIFALKNVAGWRDSLDHKHTGEVKMKSVDAMTEEEMLAEFDRILTESGITTPARGLDSKTSIGPNGKDGSKAGDP